MSCALINLSLLFALINLVKEQKYPSCINSDQNKKEERCRYGYASPRFILFRKAQKINQTPKKKAQSHINKPQKESEWCSQTSQFEFQMLHIAYEKWKPYHKDWNHWFQSRSWVFWLPHKPNTQPGYPHEDSMDIAHTPCMPVCRKIFTHSSTSKLTHSIRYLTDVSICEQKKALFKTKELNILICPNRRQKMLLSISYLEFY